PGAQPGDRRLDQVPEAVQLVPVLQVRVPGRLPGPPEARVQVPVFLLGGGDPGDEGLVAVLKGRGVPAAEVPGHRFEELVNLRVDELDARVSGARTTGVDGAGRRPVEVAGPADPFHPRLAVLQDHLRVELLLLLPDAAGE